MPLPITQLNADTFEIFDRNVCEGWERWYLLMADVHWDSPHCDRALLERYYQQARERDAGIFVFGDMFDLMGGKWDPRSDKSGVRPEHQVADYLGAIHDTAVEALQPYADLHMLMSDGNHETAILRKHEHDILGRVTRSLGIQRGAYTGYVMFRFGRSTGGQRRTINLFWHHGFGGGGRVTKGALNPSRISLDEPDADIVAYGHIHETWEFPITRRRKLLSGRSVFTQQWHVQIPTFKQEYGGGGYHMEKGRPPKPLGARWLRFFHSPRAQCRVDFEFRKGES